MFDPFGIPFLKHNQKVVETVDLSALENGGSLTLLNSVVTIHASIDDTSEPDKLFLDLQLAIYSLPLFDDKILIDGFQSEPQKVEIGGAQLGFLGTVQLVNPAPPVQTAVLGNGAAAGTGTPITGTPTTIGGQSAE